ncbi:MAG: hypothetical protein ACJ73S_18110 [Mycobacteriales bacterium]
MDVDRILRDAGPLDERAAATARRYQRDLPPAPPPGWDRGRATARGCRSSVRGRRWAQSGTR